MNTRAGPILHAIVGPTASGKGTLARAVADAVGAELLSVDSMKVYKRLDIGTAKPDAAARERYRYHLLDVVEPTASYSVASYREAALAAEADVRERGRLPLFVGGTGLYLRALSHGIFDEPSRDDAFRETLEAEAARHGSSSLHDRLGEVDPAAGERIHPNDLKRIVRALEVHHVTGRTITALQREFAASGRPVRWLGVRWARDAQNERIDRRVDLMMARGFLDEVEALEAAGDFGPTSGRAIGYAELRAHLRGETDLDAAVAAIKTHTRQFARRQVTWFRSEPAIHWLDLTPGQSPESLAAQAADHLRQ